MEHEFTDLRELLESIRTGLEDLFPDRIWVRAEIAAISVKAGGHCYLDLSQSGPSGTVAKARATIWRNRYAMLSSFFTASTGSPLMAGMTVLLRVQVSYSEIYGLSLDIDDIDPGFTLGQKEAERRRTVARLEAEGLIDVQKSLPASPLPYRLAVISAQTAAGYGDFRKHLDANEFGFVFHTDLFEAAMQGPTAPMSITGAIDRIESSPLPYDAVLIIRGGGSALDLDCFDDYCLCRRIARCRIPVLTAIGHDRDRHIADMVAFDCVKTPTALADLFLDCYMAEDERISSYSGRLRLAFVSKVNALTSRLDLLSSRIHGADPRIILSRGYLLATDADGVVMKSARKASPGGRISVLFSDGTIDCEVKDVKLKPANGTQPLG